MNASLRWGGALTSRPLLGRLPAGVVDSGLSSLATFIVGFAALRYLGTETAGLYAVSFSAFLLMASIPQALVFTPIEITAMRTVATPILRVRVFPKSLPLGGLVALAAAAVVAPVVALLPSKASTDNRTVFAATLALMSVSPLQDHVRRVLHQSSASWSAALVAGVQLSVVLTMLGVLLTLGRADAPWVPFTVLASANMASAATGLRLASRHTPLYRPLPFEVGLRHAVKVGRYLLPSSLVLFLTSFLIVAIVNAASGPAAAARAEAARLLGQPIGIIIVGLINVVSPDLVAAATTRTRSQVHRQIAHFLVAITILVTVWALAVTIPWPGNPTPQLLPRAFEAAWLAPVMVLGSSLSYASTAVRLIPLAFDRVRALLAIDVLAAVASLSVSVALATRGAWGVVLAALAWSIVAMIGSVIAMERSLRLREVAH